MDEILNFLIGDFRIQLEPFNLRNHVLKSRIIDAVQELIDIADQPILSEKLFIQNVDCLLVIMDEIEIRINFIQIRPDFLEMKQTVKQLLFAFTQPGSLCVYSLADTARVEWHLAARFF